MWLPTERKYVRKTLNTRNQTTAIERGKDLYLRLYADMRQGKSYFSITAREGVARYVQHRQRDVEAGLIVKGRLVAIKAHLKRWLAFIGADTRLTELERNACEDYYHFRVSSARRVAARQTTIINEQATINAMMSWLFRQGEASPLGLPSTVLIRSNCLACSCEKPAPLSLARHFAYEAQSTGIGRS